MRAQLEYSTAKSQPRNFRITATWPQTMEVLARDFAPLPEVDRRKIVRENCVRVYGFSLPG